jgi:hypothetical protein
MHALKAGSCVSQRAVAFHSGQLRFTAGSCISQREVAFHSGQLRFTASLKGCSANQIASFSLIENDYLYFVFLDRQIHLERLLIVQTTK